ncbi:MAG: exodeoxyribonuclease V subunit gamma [Lentisphaerae bacterium]|nr:exodeoxyribonuclease V subunit gamma [Lentisphaerota bacterium]
MITVLWGNRLETLAQRLFEAAAAEPSTSPADVLNYKHCVVVPNRIVQGWLQQEFLFSSRPSGVMANWEFPLLNIFVNDSLAQMNNTDNAPRDPAAHPFSRDAMTWRIFNLLSTTDLNRNGLSQLNTFLRPNDRPRFEHRCFKLSLRLATLFDDYTVYRPDTLLNWQQGGNRDATSDIAWQPTLWRLLTSGDLINQTYLASFVKTNDPQALNRIDLAAHFRHVHVFAPAMVPTVYLHFFEKLSSLIPVTFYTLNPSENDWFEDPPLRETMLEARNDSDTDFHPGNILLGQQGRGNRNFLVELLDRTAGQAEASSCFVEPIPDTALQALQLQLLQNHNDATTTHLANERPLPFSSIQTHICHSPLREVEVLRDHLLRWFSESTPPLEPRHVQVQVSDMALYAPYIHALFANRNPNAAKAIPYAIVDRVTTAESPIVAAFIKLLELADSYFTSTEILQLLYCDAIATTFDIADENITTITAWCNQAGIRWGHTQKHRKKLTGVNFTPATSWRHGLDRLLLGYTYGQHTLAPDNALPLPSDTVSEEAAPLLGRFISLVSRLSDWSEDAQTPRPPTVWADRLTTLINSLFTASNDNYLEIATIRNAVDLLAKSGHAANCDRNVSLATIREALNTHLKSANGGDDPGANAVVFSALGPGSTMPRRIVCLLGMADSSFPRQNNRTAYDLLRRQPRFGDRSLRQEDRMAFLEAMLNARERLYLSYTGFSTKDNSTIQPAVPLQELREAATRATGNTHCPPVTTHHLHPHHTAYFSNTKDNNLFSYSRSSFKTAQQLATLQTKKAQPTVTAAFAASPTTLPNTARRSLALNELIEFYKNPAKFFYNNRLSAWLSPRREDIPDEQEPFTTNALENYQINEKIITAFVKNTTDETTALNNLYNTLLQQGNLPLGNYGEEFFNKQTSEIKKILENKEASLLTILKKWDKATSEPATLDIENFTVNGAIKVLPREFDNAAAVTEPDFRYSSDKTSDRLACWLRLLFATACGYNRDIIYHRKNKKTLIFTGPDNADIAKDFLRNLVKIYSDNFDQIAPFIPNVSCAYYKALQESPGNRAEALDKAKQLWLKPGYNGKADKDDPYYFTAFGEDGPTSLDRFTDIAQTVFSQHFELTK